MLILQFYSDGKKKLVSSWGKPSIRLLGWERLGDLITGACTESGCTAGAVVSRQDAEVGVGGTHAVLEGVVMERRRMDRDLVLTLWDDPLEGRGERGTCHVFLGRRCVGTCNGSVSGHFTFFGR